jgi:hypothetical protein
VILPPAIARVLNPLFSIYPLDVMLTQLVVCEGAVTEQITLLELAEHREPIASRPDLRAGLWLYIDELNRSHTLSQGIDDATGSFWHGIMHRREGDFSNSHYWFNRVGKHPAMAGIPNYDPHAFVDAVRQRHAGAPPDLIDFQRQEWAALFSWCANQHRG